eukprot:evm.model.scf_1161.5 EVM.evm.TU.scf_1161.5   scf_1161:44938-45561(-)
MHAFSQARSSQFPIPRRSAFPVEPSHCRFAEVWGAPPLGRDYNVKLADFGCSKVKVQSYATVNFAGTMMYMAPECWLSNFVPGLRVHYPNIDIYSFGVVMWECITGTRPDSSMEPWKGNMEDTVPVDEEAIPDHPIELPTASGRAQSQGMDVTLRFPLSDRLPPELRELVWSCLAFYNDRRPSCTEIRNRLNEFKSASWASSFPARM